MSQGLSQLNYLRRFLALSSEWGDGDAARQVLRHAANSKSFGPSDDTLLGEGLSAALSSFSAAPVNPLKPAPYLVAPRTLSSPSFSRTRLAPYQSARISYNKNGNKNVFKHHTNVINNRFPTNLKSVNKIRGAQKSIDSPPLAHKSGISQSYRCPKGLSQSAHLVAQKSNINDSKNCGQNIRPSTKGKIKSAEQAFSQRGPIRGQTIVLGRI